MAYIHLIDEYFKETPEPINNKEVLVSFFEKFPRFKDLQQHDAQEALLCMIDILERAVPEVKPLLYGKKCQETIYPGGKKKQETDFCLHLLNTKHIKLDEALNTSFAWNVLEDYVDDDGLKHNVATTREYLQKLAPIFFISFDAKSRVQLFEELNVGYELIASATHVGSQFGGHYASYVKENGQWFLIDDNNVSPCPFPKECGHYVLMYTLKTHPV